MIPLVSGKRMRAFLVGNKVRVNGSSELGDKSSFVCFMGGVPLGRRMGV